MIPTKYDGFIASIDPRDKDVETYLLRTIAFAGLIGVEEIRSVAKKRFNCVPYIIESLSNELSPEQLREKAASYVGKSEILVFGTNRGHTSLRDRITKLEDVEFSENTQTGEQQ